MVERGLQTRIAGAVAIATLIAAIAAATAGTVLAADHAVAMQGFAFSPGSITVKVGDSVTWTNSDSASHTATADDASFDTGTIGNGSSKSVTFSTAGTFAYHCSIHAQMHGTVVVQGAAGGTPPATDTVALGSATSDANDGLIVLAVAATAWLLGLSIVRRRFANRG
jgi:plastocyanin